MNLRWGDSRSAAALAGQGALVPSATGRPDLTPTHPGWTASHYRWTAVLSTALLAFRYAGRERA